jgi:succinate dehydrogenase / fumarate reductase iron-sulfur subunit
MSEHGERTITLRIFRGDRERGEHRDYPVQVGHGMVVLDAVHRLQATLAPDLAVRWNCKAGKCGSCSAEVNGRPRLMCKVRLDELPMDRPISISPLRAFPVFKDLVTDVSFNYEVNKRIPPFQPRAGTDWRYSQDEADRVQEFRKCIECFLCQDVCHVLRDHGKKDLSDPRHLFAGPRFMVRLAALEMHPLDDGRRLRFIKEQAGIGYCNITKCCTEVCPERITITDNAIIPLKERVVDEFYDPLRVLIRKFKG